ncbi:hypothetical protein TWF730_011336 [Orbilia blumenaviensis]|uniref:Alpha/beta hydrolase fold-3 domain-containing protein n=1 Tax=Orbilia blumenaviensis TaxID=1796055 RepID=A0AAV9UNG3_9PEZI
MSRTFTWMRVRLSRNFLPTASQFTPRWPQNLPSYPRPWQHRYRCYSYAASRGTQVDESLADLYSGDYIRFYCQNISGRPICEPFENLNNRYPCREDYQEASQLGVSCHDFELPRKATGSILLRVYNASNTTSRSPVIVYLPSRETNPLSTTDEHHAISLLTKLTGATTISVGYRVSPPFPLSLHDALAAIDWVRANVPIVSLETYCKNNYDGRLMAVLGTGIGGSLAASISATEGLESGIIATGAWLPIVDWAFDPLPGIPESRLSTIPRSLARLAAYPKSQVEDIDPDILSTYSELADNPFLSSNRLEVIRSSYLAKPEDFTDPFVSPLYRFSSSGVNIWTELVSRMRSELLADPDNPPAWIRNLPDTIFKRGPRRPISYPPLHLIYKLTVPMMRIVSAEGDILHRQITEYVHAARSSIFPSEKKTIEERQEEETRELGKTHNNEIEAPDVFVGWDITDMSFSEYEDERGQGEKVMVESRPPYDSSMPGIPEMDKENDKGETQIKDNMAFIEQPKYAKGAEKYIQYDVIPKAGHCLITGATQLTDGIEEIKRMAAWLEWVFALGPNQAQEWKEQQERWAIALQEAKYARRRRVPKL